MQFPTLEDFSLYLTEQRGIQISSGVKSRFLFITSYFRDKDFTVQNIRKMLNELRTSTLYKKKELKKSTLNKYVGTLKDICKCQNISILDDFRGFRDSQAMVVPFGELLTDNEMKSIAEIFVRYERKGKSRRVQINKKYRAIFTLLRFLGTPPVDIVNLKWENDKITHLDYFRHKTGKHMIVPIPEVLRKCLDGLEREGPYIFGGNIQMKEETIREELRRRCKLLKINKHITPYSFRYSAITWCYSQASDKSVHHLADIFGHSVEIAKKHYVLYRDPKVLLDALMTSHPGLSKKADIDTIKRVILDFISKLLDVSKYEVDLTIKRKAFNMRRLTVG